MHRPQRVVALCITAAVMVRSVCAMYVCMQGDGGGEMVHAAKTQVDHSQDPWFVVCLGVWVYSPQSPNIFRSWLLVPQGTRWEAPLHYYAHCACCRACREARPPCHASALEPLPLEMLHLQLWWLSMAGQITSSTSYYQVCHLSR